MDRLPRARLDPAPKLHESPATAACTIQQAGSTRRPRHRSNQPMHQPPAGLPCGSSVSRDTAAACPTSVGAPGGATNTAASLTCRSAGRRDERSGRPPPHPHPGPPLEGEGAKRHRRICGSGVSRDIDAVCASSVGAPGGATNTAASLSCGSDGSRDTPGGSPSTTRTRSNPHCHPRASEAPSLIATKRWVLACARMTALCLRCAARWNPSPPRPSP